MRLLQSEAQDRIILHLQERVTREWPFRLPKDGIQVISGKLEGELGKTNSRKLIFIQIILTPLFVCLDFLTHNSCTEVFVQLNVSK